MNNFEQDVFESGLIKRIPELLERVYEKAESRPLFENDNLLNNILRSELPETPLSVAEIEKEILGLLMTYECNVLSPKYFGYITPRPLPISIIGDWLALLGNQCPGARRAGPLAAGNRRHRLGQNYHLHQSHDSDHRGHLRRLLHDYDRPQGGAVLPAQQVLTVPRLQRDGAGPA